MGWTRLIKPRGKLLYQVLATDGRWGGGANPCRVVTSLTHIVGCTNDISDVLPSVDQAGKAQVTHLDVSMGERLCKQNVLGLENKNMVISKTIIEI